MPSMNTFRKQIVLILFLIFHIVLPASFFTPCSAPNLEQKTFVLSFILIIFFIELGSLVFLFNDSTVGKIISNMPK